MKIDYNKLDEVLQPLRYKYAEAVDEMTKQQHLMDYYSGEIDRVQKEEIARQANLPYVPTSSEDETPDNDNPFQGREDDERVTSQLD